MDHDPSAITVLSRNTGGPYIDLQTSYEGYRADMVAGDTTSLRSAAEKALAAMDRVSLTPETWDKLKDVLDGMNDLRTALNSQPKTKL